MAKRGPEPHAFQRKSNSATQLLDTQARLFNNTPVEWSVDRYVAWPSLVPMLTWLLSHMLAKYCLNSAMNLRNEGTGGRSYDIVNGGKIQYFAPTIAEKQHPRQAHASVIVHPYTR